jgi:hypothetical protein
MPTPPPPYGAVYGTVRYGEATYGRPESYESTLPVYSAAPLIATALSYYSIQISWNIPVAGTALQLVRNNYSVSSNQNDGIVLLSQGISASAIYVDTALSAAQQGSFQYYTLWNQDNSGNWWRAGDVQALLPKNWGNGARLFSLLPSWYRDQDALLGIVATVVNPSSMAGAEQAVTSATGSMSVRQSVSGTAEALTSASAIFQEGTAEAISSASGTVGVTQEEEALYEVEATSTTWGTVTRF